MNEWVACQAVSAAVSCGSTLVVGLCLGLVFVVLIAVVGGQRGWGRVRVWAFRTIALLVGYRTRPQLPIGWSEGVRLSFSDSPSFPTPQSHPSFTKMTNP
mmetsp:Transcript_18237/g.51938  ORF Transcript_18237/g.51938 Transcript_18237/m.51938 type:complete len:100 (+) Transcript_18237:1209-1508(+)